MRLAELVAASERVRGSSGRHDKVGHLADALRSAGRSDVGLAVAYLSGTPRQGRVGVGPAALNNAWPEGAAAQPTLTLRDVDRALERMARVGGPGSTAERERLLHHLLAQGTEAEQAFLRALLFGELRQGANAGVVTEAVAKASGVTRTAVRRAAMLTGDLAGVAERAFGGGRAALDELGLTVFRPVEPMLASATESSEDALERLGVAVVEYKMDGARVQVHKDGPDVRVFSRNLRDVTASVPEIVEQARALPIDRIVLDGETLALRPEGRPEPFQVTMRRFGRKLDVAALREEVPLSSFFFDCLLLDDESLIDLPMADRLQRLDEALPEGLRIPRDVVERAEAIDRFLARARASGHEGVMVKDPTSPYAAGRRGKSWLKLKPAHTLDLVVLAAEWGHGRRKGWLSNLHLGARDPDEGGFVMLGKTFKGLTDAVLEWQTQALLDLEVSRDRHTVYVEPRLIVEIAFNELQESPRYPGGLALRFARVKRYRTDKAPSEADTIETVRAIHAAGP